MRWGLVGSAVVLTGALVVARVLGPGHSRPLPPASSIPLTQAPTPAAAAHGASFPGVVIASEGVEVSAPFEGRLEKLSVQVGDTVAAGAVLGQLALHSLQHEVEMAEARLAAARVEEAQFELEATESSARLARLLRAPAGTFPEEELASARHQEKVALNRLEAGRAAIREHQAALSQSRRRLAEGVLLAPFEARVVERFLDPGAAVRPGETILRLSRAGPARVRFAIPLEQLREVAVGGLVRIELPGLGRSMLGKIENLSPEVDAASQLIFAVAALGTPGEPLDGIVVGAVARVAPLGESGAMPMAAERAEASRP